MGSNLLSEFRGRCSDYCLVIACLSTDNQRTSTTRSVLNSTTENTWHILAAIRDRQCSSVLQYKIPSNAKVAECKLKKLFKICVLVIPVHKMY